ncbi:heterokaryon incompatibility protein-domain-containing protein [Podospora didyma]|uniref:Heterokaryon incompatibility protein-domain-containing protein n=1 Tax=Podospora didyma TaxID=330526 RepID=A0AAE0NQ71_9PEZI|nr:heterokaryon incompatibility protein-domain-containing protein [Podospora didyma]
MSYYSPLDPTKNEIRLLQVHKGEAGDDIKCTLSTISLHTHYDYEFKKWEDDCDQYAPTAERSQCTTHHPPYEALSYQWGSRHESQSPPTIAINSILTPVTPNLHSALQQMRHAQRDRTLWVDALCINQADAAEKDSQVQRMAAIYRLAERVLVWLGVASSDSGLAMATLKKLGGDSRDFSAPAARGVMCAGPNFHRFDGNWPYEDRDELKKVRMPDTLSSAAPEWLESIWAENDAAAKRLGLLKTADLSEAQWTALGRLFTTALRPWWKRIWVVQEVALAREVVICCGAGAVLWDTLHDLLRQKSCIQSHRLMLILKPWVMIDITRSIARNPLRFWGLEPIGYSLLEVTSKFWPWDSTNPRDKVYALLGLASGSASRQVLPRYGSHVADVFSEAAAAMIEESQNLDVLCQVHCLEDNETVTAARAPDWPSWVPDWSMVQDIELLVDISSGSRPYDTSGPWRHSNMMSPPNVSGHMRGGWVSKWTAGSADMRESALEEEAWTASGIRWPAHPTTASTTPAALSRTLHFLPRFHAKLHESRRLEVLGKSWARIDTLLEPAQAERIATSSYRSMLLQWYSTVKYLPRFPSASDSFLSEAMTLAGIRGCAASTNKRTPELLSDSEFYHGFILMSVLLVGQYRLPSAAINAESTEIVDQRLTQRCIGCSVVRFLAWIGYIDINDVKDDLADDPVASSHDFHFMAQKRLRGWKLAVLANRHYGLVPSGAREGDTVAILFGSCVPFVLRPGADEETWSVIGSCYFFHIMRGEIWNLMRLLNVAPVTFLLC